MSLSAPRILLIGDRGQVGWELRRSLATLGEVIAVGRNTSPHSLDLSQPNRIPDLVAALQPAWIVNAAAYTAVDKAETETGLANTINAEAPGTLAEAAQQAGALLVHYSTDYVFDGGATSPYIEDNPTQPQSVYGRSKLAGEEAIRAAGGDHLILRTAWVYGNRGGNFLRTIRRLAREREELRIVADQRGAPTWCRHIAEATAQALARLGRDRGAWQSHTGTYHLTSAGECSWYDFACRIVEHQRLHEAVQCQRITPITTADYPTPARRPAYSVLNCDKLASAFGIRLPGWQEALLQVQEDLDACQTAN